MPGAEGGVGTSSQAGRPTGISEVEANADAGLIPPLLSGVFSLRMKTLELPSLTRAPCRTRGREGRALSTGFAEREAHVQHQTPGWTLKPQFPLYKTDCPTSGIPVSLLCMIGGIINGFLVKIR